MWFLIGFVATLVFFIPFTVALKFSSSFRKFIGFSTESSMGWKRPTKDEIKLRMVATYGLGFFLGTLGGKLTLVLVFLMTCIAAIAGLVYLLWAGLKKLISGKVLGDILDAFLDL